MKHQLIQHIIREIFKRLKKNLPHVKKNLEEHRIHNFRIAIKQLRAFTRLVRLSPGAKPGCKIPGRLKEVYRAAGKIRVLQLQVQWIKEFYIKPGHPPAAYLAQLKSEQKATGKDIIPLMSRQSLDNIEKKILAALPAVLLKHHPRFFVDQQIAAIRSILSAKRIPEEHWHQIRKHLKDILYIYSLLKEFAPTRSRPLFLKKSTFKTATRLAHELGLVNDKVIAIAMIDKKRLSLVNGPEQAQLLALRKQLLLEKRLAKIKIHQSLVNSFLFKKAPY